MLCCLAEVTLTQDILTENRRYRQGTPDSKAPAPVCDAPDAHTPHRG